MAELDERVADEIEALHVEFERWLGGASSSLDRIEASLAEGFTIVPPRGAVVARAELMEGLRRARGTRPIRIRVERPVVRWSAGEAVLATYEEWHEHAEYTTCRQSTVLFTRDARAPGGLLWRHVHETFRIPPPTWSMPAPAGS